MDENIKENFTRNYDSDKPQILQKELIADIETPISCFIKISKDEKS